MKLNKLTASVLLALGVQTSASAADLLDTYHAAQGQDAVFASARAAQQAGKEKLTQGRSGLLPSVTLSANSTYNDNNVQFPGATRQMSYTSSAAGITLVQPLLRQQNWMGYSESELQVAISDAQFHLAEQDLILRTAQAYFDVLLAQDSVQLAETQKRAISEQLEQAKRNFEVGTATITDTYEAQARFDLNNAQLIAAQSTLEIKLRQLQQMTNAGTAALKPVGSGLKLEVPQPADSTKWEEEAQKNNLQVLIAQASAEIADKEVSRNRGANYPTLDLVANVTKSSANGGVFNGAGYGPADTTSKSVGVQFNMPLFQGGALNSKWREAEANRDKAQQDLENARRNVSLQVRQAYLGVESGMAQVKALQQALKSNESLFESSKLGQNVGVRTNLDVLNAQQQLISTRRDLMQAQYNFLMSQLRLEAAAGSLDENDLARINQALH